MRFALIALSLCLFSITASISQSQRDETTPAGHPSGDGWFNLIPANLVGWKAEPAYWMVNRGVLEGYTPGTAEHHYAYTAKEYADFELHADVKLVGYNSGICIRIKPTSSDNVPGYQVDMGEGYWGCLWEERGRGMLADYGKANADRILHKNDWNHYYVRAVGHHIEAWLNGAKTIDIVDDAGNLTGPIGFQLTHGVGNKTAASFRNVYIRLLRPDGSPVRTGGRRLGIWD